MENDKVLEVMGSPGSGKTSTVVKLALTLATPKKNVIVVFCDPFTLVIPAVLPASILHDTSLGSLLTVPTLAQTDILNACVPIESGEYISLLGYCGGESLMHYPKIKGTKRWSFSSCSAILPTTSSSTAQACLKQTPCPSLPLKWQTGY